MNLKFLLRIEGHHGIPDGQWQQECIIDDDRAFTVESMAKTLILAEAVRWNRSPLTEADTQFDVKFDGRQTLTVTPGERWGCDCLECTLTPLLSIADRYFTLTEHIN